MKLIDADKLIAQMEEDAEHMDDVICQMMTYAAINDVKKQPVIDIVQCRECEYRDKGDYGYCPLLKKNTYADFFCAYGERSTDDEI